MSIERLSTEAPPPARRQARAAGAPPPARETGTKLEPRVVTFEPPAVHVGHRIVLYGPGGIGKTSLADLAPGPVVSFDLDDSLGVLRPQNTQRVAGIVTWDDLHQALIGTGWDGVKTIVIDSVTKAEELAVAHTLANTPKNEQGGKAKSVEDYGYGKGFGFVFDTFLPLLADLDSHVQAGRNVILIAHECTNRVPNPEGEDWIRYEPRLQDPSSGKGSLRLRIKEWADHLLYIGYDVAVNKEHKAQGGTRTLYPTERPHFMAKSRVLRDAVPITEGDGAVWDQLFKTQEDDE